MRTYVPEYRVRIGGRPLPAAASGCVVRVAHTDGIVGADRVELTLANPDLRWLDDPLFQIDNTLELALGYAGGPLDEMFFGEITGVTPSFPAGGMPMLTVVAHDRLQRLTVGTKDRRFEVSVPCMGKFPLPDLVVADLVAATNLFVPVVDPVGASLSFVMLMLAYAVDPLEAKRSIRIQQNQSDFDFLTKIAVENGWEMAIDHAAEPHGYVVRFRSLFSDFAASETLTWGQSLIEFNPRLSTVGQVAAVATHLWVPTIKTAFVIVLGWDYDRAAFDFQVYPNVTDLGGALGVKAVDVLHVPSGGPAELPKTLLGELLPRLNSRLTGSGTAVGNTRLRAGGVVNLDGLGERFGGLYRLTAVTHTIDGGGFRTAFEARKEVWFSSVPVPGGVGGLARVQSERIG